MFVPAQAKVQAYDTDSKALSSLDQGHCDMMAPDQADMGPLHQVFSLSWGSLEGGKLLSGENPSVLAEAATSQREPCVQDPSRPSVWVHAKSS